jgi:hypothetical protein
MGQYIMLHALSPSGLMPANNLSPVLRGRSIQKPPASVYWTYQKPRRRAVYLTYRRVKPMSEQEIRAKALELAIATYQMLPESKRTDAIKREVDNGREVFQQMENLADLYREYIKI